MLITLKFVPIILKLCQHNWSKPNLDITVFQQWCMHTHKGIYLLGLCVCSPFSSSISVLRLYYILNCSCLNLYKSCKMLSKNESSAVMRHHQLYFEQGPVLRSEVSAFQAEINSPNNFKQDTLTEYCNSLYHAPRVNCAKYSMICYYLDLN